MNRVGAGTSGYTIVEVMIFLAVSGLMFLSALMFLGGQQNKNEFTTGIKDIQAQLVDYMNDVSTGYYNSKDDFKCDLVSGNVKFTSAPQSLGTNAICIYVGRIIHFSPTDYGNKTFVVRTLIGKRQSGTPATDVRTLKEASPKIVNDGAVSNDLKVTLPYDISIVSVIAKYGPDTNIGSLAFVTNFAGNSGTGGIVGSQDIELIPVKTTSLSDTLSIGQGIVESDQFYLPANSKPNPKGGVEICFKSGGTNQSAKITIGGTARQSSTLIQIYSNGTCT